MSVIVDDFKAEMFIMQLRLHIENRSSIQKDFALTSDILYTKATAEIGTFTAHASTWDVDEQRDRIVQGAFSESIRENGGRVPLLWHHKHDTPIGIAVDLKEESSGLSFRGQLALGTVRGRETLELLRMGAIDGISIGFLVPEGGAKNRGTVREISRVRLLELSVVSFPANRGARVHAGSVKGWL